MSNVDLSVGFSIGQQSAMVGHCLTNEEFFIKCKAKIKPEWLTGDLYVAHVFQELIKFYENYKMMPRSAPELLDEAFFKTQKPIDLEKYKSTVTVCLSYAQNFSLEILRPKITDFIRSTSIKEQAKIIVVDTNKQNYDKVVQASNTIQKIWNEVDFDAPAYVDFSDSVSLWTKQEAVEERSISTGSTMLDDILGSGLKRGGNMAVIAPTFTGKSRFLITMARHALVQRKKVLYIIHEDDPGDVKRRIIASVCGIGPKELTTIINGGFKTKADLPPTWLVDSWGEIDRQYLYNIAVQELTRAQKLLTENLIFLPWQRAGKMFVEDVAEEIRRIDLEQRSKTGKGLDLIIDDYPKLLKNRMKAENDRTRLENTYQYFNDLARELNIFTIYAVQANRAAAKQMKHGEAEWAVGLEDAGESYGISQNAMSAVSLNRSQEDSDRNILRISIPKARDAKMNNMILTRSAYNECVLYGDARMFVEFGQMLIKGLVCAKSGQYMAVTTTVDAQLVEAEAELSLPNAVLQSQVPAIIKKIKGLPIV